MLGNSLDRAILSSSWETDLDYIYTKSEVRSFIRVSKIFLDVYSIYYHIYTLIVQFYLFFPSAIWISYYCWTPNVICCNLKMFTRNRKNQLINSIAQPKIKSPDITENFEVEVELYWKLLCFKKLPGIIDDVRLLLKLTHYVKSKNTRLSHC